MRRADRLFEILLLLQGRKRAVTGREIARRFEISLRTVYRDIQDLAIAGIPIDGEPGVGYRLRPGSHVPPLMFQDEELEALQLGAAMVRAWADPKLARAAETALERISAVVPSHVRARTRRLFVPDLFVDGAIRDRALALRSAIREGVKVRMAYASWNARAAERVVEPLALFFWGARWTLAAWCTVRRDFRMFRLDRMRDVTPMTGSRCDHTLDEYLAHGVLRTDTSPALHPL